LVVSSLPQLVVQRLANHGYFILGIGNPMLGQCYLYELNVMMPQGYIHGLQWIIKLGPSKTQS